MKSFFMISFFVTLLLTAGPAFSYDCSEKNPPQIRPCACSQSQKPQCRQQHQPCPTRCGQCDKCNNSRMHKKSYQCKTTCSQKTERVTTMQCKLCGIHHPKDVEHYCDRAQCRSCGQIHPRDVAHRCGLVQCRTCGVQHPQDMRHRCGEIRNQHQDCSQGDCFQGNACRYESKHKRYEGKHKQCATRSCNLTRRESRASQETMETRWHAWFKNQANQAREEATF